MTHDRADRRKSSASLQNALHAYLDDFGHEEADVLREVKALIAKLQPAK